ncbi:MAG: hypothetical protein KH812_12045, partial [Proteus hauseri]|nr:hypothetical protein [Proteus hauseri]
NGGLLIRMSLVQVQLEEPNLEKPALSQCGLFALHLFKYQYLSYFSVYFIFQISALPVKYVISLFIIFIFSFQGEKIIILKYSLPPF